LRSLLKTLRLEPFFLLVSLVESHSPYTRLGQDKEHTCAILKWVLTGSANPQGRRFWRTYPHRAKTRRAVEIATATLQR